MLMEKQLSELKVKYHELKGVSARLEDSDMDKFKVMMKNLKSKYGSGFSFSDLIQVIIQIKPELLDEEITRFRATQKSPSSILGRLDISDDAKSKIEAILAEEAMKKG
jgi:hypothetical protein